MMQKKQNFVRMKNDELKELCDNLERDYKFLILKQKTPFSPNLDNRIKVIDCLHQMHKTTTEDRSLLIQTSSNAETKLPMFEYEQFILNVLNGQIIIMSQILEKIRSSKKEFNSRVTGIVDRVERYHVYLQWHITLNPAFSILPPDQVVSQQINVSQDNSFQEQQQIDHPNPLINPPEQKVPGETKLNTEVVLEQMKQKDVPLQQILDVLKVRVDQIEASNLEANEKVLQLQQEVLLLQQNALLAQQNALLAEDKIKLLQDENSVIKKDQGFQQDEINALELRVQELQQHQMLQRQIIGGGDLIVNFMYKVRLYHNALNGIGRYHLEKFLNVSVETWKHLLSQSSVEWTVPLVFKISQLKNLLNKGKQNRISQAHLKSSERVKTIYLLFYFQKKITNAEIRDLLALEGEEILQHNEQNVFLVDRDESLTTLVELIQYLSRQDDDLFLEMEEMEKADLYSFYVDLTRASRGFGLKQKLW